VALTGFTLGGAGVLAGIAGLAGLAAPVVTAGAAAGVLLGLVGTGQLGVSLRRALDG
jgi:CDP-diacylglycerol--glycerol-3-phosphate 3-phosphatidyltransferase